MISRGLIQPLWFCDYLVQCFSIVSSLWSSLLTLLVLLSQCSPSWFSWLSRSEQLTEKSSLFPSSSTWYNLGWYSVRLDLRCCNDRGEKVSSASLYCFLNIPFSFIAFWSMSNVITAHHIFFPSLELTETHQADLINFKSKCCHKEQKKEVLKLT